jgi:hypothetical protein
MRDERPMILSTLTSPTFAAAASALVVVATVLNACSDSPSPGPATGQPSSTGAPVVLNGPEDVARRAVQAQIDGDKADYRELVRFDRREYFSMHDLRGCDLQNAQLLVEEESSNEAVVTVVFGQPCGSSPVGKLEGCGIRLTRLSDRWYVEGGDLGTYCEAQGP